MGFSTGKIERRTMRNKSILIHYSLFTIPFFASAAVPQRWVVETSQVKPVVFEAIHGETLALEASFKSYGTDVSTSNMTAFLCWQTNGMKNVWWVTNAVTSGHSASVLFKPSMDPGVPVVNAYLGLSESTNNQLPSTIYHLPSISYRAAFTIRFRHGPGAVPNAIAAPVPILDLAHTVVVNPPWPTEADFAATTTVMKAELKGYVDDQIEGAGLVTHQAVTNISARVTSNVVTRAFVESHGIEAGLSTSDVDAILESSTLCSIADAKAMTNALVSTTAAAVYEERGFWKTGEIAWIPCRFDGSKWSCFDYNGNAITISRDGANMHMVIIGQKLGDMIADATMTYDDELGEWIVSNERFKLSTGYWRDTASNAKTLDFLTPVQLVSSLAYTNGGARAYADANFAAKTTVNQLGASVAAIGAHLNAEDARFVSTNYDSVANMPEAYCEIKIKNKWKTIWKEMTRWGKFVGNAFNWSTWHGFHAWSTNVTAQLAKKAERCWGIYDSETGEYSPDGFTQISSSNILIAANMSYKRVVDTANAIWVLECNQGTATFGGETNGYFRVKDGDGNTQFEIIKGNQRELGCDAGGITVARSGGNNVMTILYSVVANNHPTLKICTDLVASDWVAEGSSGCAGTVVWSGGSGAYVATVTVPASTPSAFVKATYLGGSETIINNVAPTKMQYIYIGNTKYAIGYTTIGGHGVMTLTPQ